MPQLTAITTITATLELVTGLRVGAGDSEMHIGGVDNTVIKHPHICPLCSKKRDHFCSWAVSSLDLSYGALEANFCGSGSWLASHKSRRIGAHL